MDTTAFGTIELMLVPCKIKENQYHHPSQLLNLSELSERMGSIFRRILRKFSFNSVMKSPWNGGSLTLACFSTEVET